MRSECFFIVQARNETTIWFPGRPDRPGLTLHDRDPSDPTRPGPESQAFIERARELGAPVYQHEQDIPTGADGSVADLIAAARESERILAEYLERYRREGLPGCPLAALSAPTRFAGVSRRRTF